MGKTSHADEILEEMAQILGFSKTAGDIVTEFKTQLATASTEAAVDALYERYKGQLRRVPSQEDWEALVNAKKGQLRSGRPAEDGSAAEHTLAYLVEIADALDAYGFADIASIVDDTIRKVSAYKTK
jgi:hypothetical protein